VVTLLHHYGTPYYLRTIGISLPQTIIWT